MKTKSAPLNEEAKLIDHGTVVEIDGKRYDRRAIEQLPPIKLPRTITIGALHYSVETIQRNVTPIVEYYVGNVVEFVVDGDDPDDKVFTSIIARVGPGLVGMVSLEDGNLWDHLNFVELPVGQRPIEHTKLFSGLTIVRKYEDVKTWSRSNRN
jgi:hypothetical protein